MKTYELSSKLIMTPRTPLIIRVDGRSFHNYTRRFDKPWSIEIRDAMTEAAKALVQDISGAKVAYCQSDEISILVTDYDSLNCQPWFGKSVQKIASVSASIATAHFNLSITSLALNRHSKDLSNLGESSFYPPAYFDARGFVLPKEEVSNYFIWRQKDAIRNSVSALAQAHFSAKEMFAKNSKALRDMLRGEKGIEWEDCALWQQRGWCVLRTPYDQAHAPENRATVQADWEIPVFVEDREYITSHVFVGEH